MIGAAKEDVEADPNQAKKIFSAGNDCRGVIVCKMILADFGNAIIPGMSEFNLEERKSGCDFLS